MSRWLPGTGLFVLVALNLLVLAWLGVEAFNSLHPDSLVIANASDVARAFGEYQGRAEALQKLVAALIGLSSLYSLALGFTTYLNAQQYMETLKANAGRIELAKGEAEAQVKRLEAQFPTFGRIHESVAQMAGRLEELLPDTEWIAQHYDRMTPQDHEEVAFYEKSVAFFNLLDLKSSSPLEVYLRFCKYYRAKNASESRSRIATARSALDRAEFYLNKYAATGDDFVAYTERAIISYRRSNEKEGSEAAFLFKRSLEKEPRQQRARYWLSVLQHRAGDYLNAEKLLVEALAQQRWERQENSDRLIDIHYNLACARSRIAESISDIRMRERYAALCIADLTASATRADSNTLKYFEDDQKRGEDLWYVGTLRPQDFAEIRKKLGG